MRINENSSEGNSKSLAKQLSHVDSNAQLKQLEECAVGAAAFLAAGALLAFEMRAGRVAKTVETCLPLIEKDASLALAKSMDKDLFAACAMPKPSLGKLSLEAAPPGFPKINLPDFEVKYSPTNVDPLARKIAIDASDVGPLCKSLPAGPLRNGRPILIEGGSSFDDSAYKWVPGRKLLPQELRSRLLAKYPFLADNRLSVQNLREADDLR